MSYTPPAGDAVVVDITGGAYTPPSSAALLFELASAPGTGLTDFPPAATLHLGAPSSTPKVAHAIPAAVVALTMGSDPVTMFKGQSSYVYQAVVVSLSVLEPDMLRSTVMTDGVALTAGAPAPYAHISKVRIPLAADYSIRYTVGRAVGAPYRESLLASVGAVYGISGPVAKEVRAGYEISNVERLLLSLASPYVMNRIATAIEAVYSYRPAVSTSVASKYNMANAVIASVASLYGLLSINKIQKKVGGIYSLLSATQVIGVSDEPFVTVGGVQVSIEAGDVSSSEGGFAWECNLTLVKMEDYARFQRDTPFTVTLYGEEYSFITDGKELSRGAPAEVRARVMGISPSAVLAAPRAQLQDFLWEVDTFASAIASEVSGGAVEWGIVDWRLPAYRVSFTRSSPMDILRRLAEVAGGVVESTKAGALRIRPLFPVSIPQYASASLDQTFVETTDIVAVSENYAYDEVYNRYRLLDVDSAAQDTLVWEQSDSDPYAGIMRAYPFPWRTTVFLVHTGDAQTVIGPVSYNEQEHEDVVEVFEGAGSTSAPIHSILSLEWLATNLGGVVYAEDAKQFTATGPSKNSLVRIKYLSRSLEYPVTSGTGNPTQFLLEEVINT